MGPSAHVDLTGQPLIVGDRVLVDSIPTSLIKELPESDREAIKNQIGRTLTISGFDNWGNAELEFSESMDSIHTIWIETSVLRKLSDENGG
ncbi:MAG: hypothetical protein JO366_00710 [Methylobacteriaceae bacterium]|nr:hypothetical protein [Methylobacteriaceae bacterium]